MSRRAAWITKASRRQGLSESTIKFGEQELKRLRVALADSISELIAARRVKIKELWL